MSAPQLDVRPRPLVLALLLAGAVACVAPSRAGLAEEPASPALIAAPAPAPSEAVAPAPAPPAQDAPSVVAPTPDDEHGDDAHAGGHAAWSYDDPSAWGSLDPAYAVADLGTRQSPIDITSSTAAKLPELELDYEPFPLRVLDDGHTIRVPVPEGSTATLGDDVYALVDLHFHTPSEHKVKGSGYPMEAHFVHRDEQGDLAVVGVFVQAGDEHPLFYRLMANVGPSEGVVVERAGESVDLREFLPKSRASWRYQGSLTTPPCTEGVRWIVLQQPIEFSEAQIELFRDHYPLNARPVQPHAGRWVLSQ